MKNHIYTKNSVSLLRDLASMQGFRHCLVGHILKYRVVDII